MSKVGIYSMHCVVALFAWLTPVTAMPAVAQSAQVSAVIASTTHSTPTKCRAYSVAAKSFNDTENCTFDPARISMACIVSPNERTTVTYWPSLTAFIEEGAAVGKSLWVRRVEKSESSPCAIETERRFDGGRPIASILKQSGGGACTYAEETLFSTWDSSGRPTQATKQVGGRGHVCQLTMAYDDAARSVSTTYSGDHKACVGKITELYDANLIVVRETQEYPGGSAFTAHSPQRVFSVCQDGRQFARGWMTKAAYDRKTLWTGKQYNFRYPFAQGPQRPAPSEYEPWVFLSDPPNCPQVARENWQGGMLPYLIHAAEKAGAEFLDRSEWSSVRPTGRTLTAYWPDVGGKCHTFHADFVEVEYVAVRPASAATASQVRRSGIDSPAWRSWRDIALSWCAANKGKCSDAAIKDLRDPPSAKGAAPNCPGTLEEIGLKEAKLTTWNCNGGTTVRFVRGASGWAVSKIESDEGGGD